jgi:hypothetical protein
MVGHSSFGEKEMNLKEIILDYVEKNNIPSDQVFSYRKAVVSYLEANNYDGLYNEKYFDCWCLLDSYRQSKFYGDDNCAGRADCVPGYEIICDCDGCIGDYGYHIRPIEDFSLEALQRLALKQ